MHTSCDKVKRPQNKSVSFFDGFKKFCLQWQEKKEGSNYTPVMFLHEDVAATVKELKWDLERFTELENCKCNPLNYIKIDGESAHKILYRMSLKLYKLEEKLMNPDIQTCNELLVRRKGVLDLIRTVQCSIGCYLQSEVDALKNRQIKLCNLLKFLMTIEKEFRFITDSVKQQCCNNGNGRGRQGDCSNINRFSGNLTQPCHNKKSYKSNESVKRNSSHKCLNKLNNHDDIYKKTDKRSVQSLNRCNNVKDRFSRQLLKKYRCFSEDNNVDLHDRRKSSDNQIKKDLCSISDQGLCEDESTNPDSTTTKIKSDKQYLDKGTQADDTCFPCLSNKDTPVPNKDTPVPYNDGQYTTCSSPSNDYKINGLNFMYTKSRIETSVQNNNQTNSPCSRITEEFIDEQICCHVPAEGEEDVDYELKVRSGDCPSFRTCDSPLVKDKMRELTNIWFESARQLIDSVDLC